MQNQAQKQVLISVLDRDFLKTIGYSFMKIMIYEPIQAPFKTNLKHYDLQQQGISIITSFLSDKIQMAQLKGFTQIKFIGANKGTQSKKTIKNMNLLIKNNDATNQSLKKDQNYPTTPRTFQKNNIKSQQNLSIQNLSRYHTFSKQIKQKKYAYQQRLSNLLNHMKAINNQQETCSFGIKVMTPVKTRLLHHAYYASVEKNLVESIRKDREQILTHSKSKILITPDTKYPRQSQECINDYYCCVHGKH